MTTRRFSWLLAVLAFFGPALWAAHEIRIDAEAQRAAHGLLCGTPAVAITLLALLAASVLSLASVGTNLWSLKARTGALTVGRKAEVFLLSAPALVGIGLTVYLVLFE